MDTLTLIKESFETWYNKNVSKELPVSIAINYSDLQQFSIKAIHTIKMEVSAIGIKNNYSFVKPILTLQENYNHGVTSAEEAKEAMMKKMLIGLLQYK